MAEREEHTEPKSALSKVATDAAVYALLMENGSQTRETLALRTGKTVRTIQRALDKLVGEGRIKRVGSNKTGHWEVLR